MKVLVIGGTGYIGSAIVRRLRRVGHVPVVLARTATAGPGSSGERRTGDLARPATIAAAVTADIDAVVHAGAPTGNWDTDLAAVDGMRDALHDRGRTLIYLSGIWVLGSPGSTADETHEPRPIEIVAGRPAVEASVVGDRELRGLVVRPGIVHGAGGGIPAMMVDWARERGHGLFVGAPDVHWPMVHLDDLAALVILALERGEAGSVIHGVAEPAVAAAELAAAADVAAGGSGIAQPWPRSEAAKAIGAPLAEAMALSQEISARVAREMGWAPTAAGAVTDLRVGSYAARPSAVRVQPSEAASRTEDLAEILEVIQHLQDAQQAESPNAFMSLFHPETVWTTAHGHRMIGREEIDAFTRRVLPGAMRESTATYRVEHVLFVESDVAVVNVRQRPVAHTGLPLAGVPEGRPVYVVAKRDGEWRIAAGQNTQVHDG